MSSSFAGGATLSQHFLRASCELTDLEQTALRELVQLAERNEAQPLHLSEFQPAGAALRRKLRAHTEKLDELRELAVEHGRPVDRAEAERHVQRHAAEGIALLDSVRELGARVQANRPAQEAAERAALLLGTDGVRGDDEGGHAGAVGGRGAGTGQQRQGLSDRMAVQSAREATSALARTRKMMAEELQRSDVTLRSLDMQGKSLRDTLQEHRSIVGSLAASRRALSRLQRRDLTDKILLAVGFSFFCLVVLHIAKKRLGLASSRMLWLLFGWWRGNGSAGELLAAAAEEAAAAAAAAAMDGGAGVGGSIVGEDGAGGMSEGLCEWSESLKVYIGEKCSPAANAVLGSVAGGEGHGVMS